MSIIYWLVIIVMNQWKVNIDKWFKNSIQIRHEYTIVNLLYVDNTGKYQKYITRNMDHIGSLQYTQMGQFGSRGAK